MGIELDVLVGHPEHELLFVATQVARAAGLKEPSHAVNMYRNKGLRGLSLSTLMSQYDISVPADHLGKAMRSTSTIFNEPEVYAMLLKGRAPQSEPFRRWVTEEVLPTIRKTGSCNAETSTNPIAMGVMDELKASLYWAV